MKKKKIRIHVLGAGYEVGRNAFVFIYPTGERILLDCGLNADNNCKQEERYPLDIKKLHKIDLAFISHPHLDHLGALPMARKYGLNCPIIVPNEITRDVAALILYDSLKLENLFFETPGYEEGWVKNTLRNMEIGKSGKFGNVTWTLIESSHIPGSVSILLKHPETKSILYPGDIKMAGTKLMKKRSFLPYADIMFIDSTYGNVVHSDRKDVEKQFERIITRTIKKNGTVVIPCFSVARSQEILILLDSIRKKLKVPVYLDGMGRGVTKTYLEHAGLLDDKKLIKAIKNIKFIETRKDRFEALSKPGIIVPSGGMVESPLVHFYIENIADKKKNTIILTGFQANGTGGHDLTTKGTLTIGKKTKNERTIKPKCSIHHLSFSAHSDALEIKALIKTVNPELVIAIHGEEDGIKGALGIAKELGIKSKAPKTGDKILI